MGKVRYIKKDNGELAGSFRGPVAAPTPQPNIKNFEPGGNSKESDSAGLNDAYKYFSQQKNVEEPEWVQASPFPLLNTIRSDNYVLAVDYSIEESEYTVGDRLKTGLVKQEKAELLLRGEEVSRIEGAPGTWTSVVRYPTYMSEDGSCVATQIARGDFGSSQTNGIVTSEGEFISDPGAFGDALGDRVGEPGCPLYDEVEGYVDDWQIQTITNRDHMVLGLHIKASCREVDIEDSDLINPDSAWDSRFD